jgi:hypothetical protein
MEIFIGNTRYNLCPIGILNLYMIFFWSSSLVPLQVLIRCLSCNLGYYSFICSSPDACVTCFRYWWWPKKCDDTNWTNCLKSRCIMAKVLHAKWEAFCDGLSGTFYGPLLFHEHSIISTSIPSSPRASTKFAASCLRHSIICFCSVMLHRPIVTGPMGLKRLLTPYIWTHYIHCIGSGRWMFISPVGNCQDYMNALLCAGFLGPPGWQCFHAMHEGVTCPRGQRVICWLLKCSYIVTSIL